MSSDDYFLKKVQFSDEATFHVSGAVNHPNVRIWGSENQHASVNIVSMCAVSPMVFTSNKIKKKNKLFQFSCCCE
jgi:hypothetical protein